MFRSQENVPAKYVDMVVVVAFKMGPWRDLRPIYMCVKFEKNQFSLSGSKRGSGGVRNGPMKRSGT